MNQEETVRMANEAGMQLAWIATVPGSNKMKVLCDFDQVQRLVEIAAAAERNKLAAWMIQRSYATGHGDTTEALLKELDWQIDERIGKERGNT